MLIENYILNFGWDISYSSFFMPYFFFCRTCFGDNLLYIGVPFTTGRTFSNPFGGVAATVLAIESCTVFSQSQ
ncbi:MAG: hypothetical protein ACJA2C_002185 [Marinoscillum sp.]|jgi:hypothetical protein